MRIAYVCTEKLPSPAIKGGAIQMMIDGIVPYLKQHYELTIFSITDSCLPSKETKNGIQYIRFPAIVYPNEVARVLKQQKFDLVHVFNRPKYIPLFKKAAPTSSFILGLHNEMMAEHKLTIEEGNIIIAALAGIVTISDYIRKTVIERFPQAEEKVVVAYSGVNLQKYPPVWSEEGKEIRERQREKYGLEQKKVILFVGRLTKAKGPHLLIQAMHRIVKKHPDAVLVVAGAKWFSDDGSNTYTRTLQKMAEPLRDHIRFTGFIPADEIQDIFFMADVFVCSSQWNEPLARVHYEAMAAGTPLITTNRGGNTEVVRDEYNGFVIDDYDHIDAFVQKIDDVLTNPLFALWMAENGRETITQNFTFAHTAYRLMDAYKLFVPSIYELPL